MMDSLIWEREQIRNEATNEVSAKWGGSQTVGGPILSIPYKARLKAENGKEETVIRYAHFLPDQLHIKRTIAPEKRYRGIYVFCTTPSSASMGHSLIRAWKN
jgi:inner membrane protein